MTRPTDMNPFETIIYGYLEARAKTDELFAKTFAKPNKNIHECYKYIVGELYQQALKNREGNMGLVPMTDEDTFQMAVHYYDEDEITIKKCEGARTAVAKTEGKKDGKTDKKSGKTDTKPKESAFAKLTKKAKAEVKKTEVKAEVKKAEDMSTKELKRGDDCGFLF